MTSSDTASRELVAQLEELHQDSFSWALSCCAWNHADAEDVLQTTYLKVVSGTALFDGRSSVRTWLFGVIRRTALEHHRRTRSQRECAERLARESPHGLEHRDDPGSETEKAEAAHALRESMAALPARQRQILHLVFYEDLSVKEAAGVMEVSVGSARIHYHRGKKRLRALLSGRMARGGSP